MSFTNFIIYAAFTVSLMGLTFYRAHLLSALICLEGMMLSLFIGLTLWTSLMESATTSISPMILLTLSACEAGTGLSILVATTRTHGTDLLQNMSALQC
uniref:NADH-ubiquinone oxidoreductase chain 4L n=1 Tax=Oscaecilia ochrocephala TaxID=543905 RepID=C9D8K6_OSCOC|nr:NADH dehydrogenase subunit 4L [Oscaecilia ochrocephala]ACS37139.1 NADH dehydrogenase subunit 4L [Oscaecilia ochrocephala]